MPKLRLTEKRMLKSVTSKNWAAVGVIVVQWLSGFISVIFFSLSPLKCHLFTISATIQVNPTRHILHSYRTQSKTEKQQSSYWLILLWSSPIFLANLTVQSYFTLMFMKKNLLCCVFRI